ncbi:hypothetical protein KIH39_03950 [Telmatocola sphagniphila]|uniref:Uncharacterized protein n=1 Tax=Telmatocola sphagniphila TaxID=1123043 RepID=A0A8E6EU00_9BACT|nr:hypothetical protein [Telmatocola sphagniphila]QVL33079.1 hypothetical protein KIH39_03950 [Telmatocola sphagniphila]
MANANLTAKLSEISSTIDTAQIPLPNCTLELTGVVNDSLSSRFRSLKLKSTSTGPELTAGEVKTWSQQVAGKVTGLLEPLKVLEVDEPQKTALLRSATPTKGNGEVSYYEMLLHSDRSCEMTRYQASTGESKPREVQPMTLTHEVLSKLIDDVMG